MSRWCLVEWISGELIVEAGSSCMLQEASPNLFFPTAVAWEELKTALSDLNFSRIRSDLQVVDGFEVSWDIKWDGIKSGGTVVNPRGEEFEILQAAFGAFTVSDNFPRGVTDPFPEELD